MTGICLLSESLVQCNRTGHTNVQRLYDTNLRNNKITVRHCSYLIAYAAVFIAKNKGNTFCKINTV